MRCWGYSGYGQLGSGVQRDVWSPPSVDLCAAYPTVSVSFGILHACALRENGDLYCYGINKYVTFFNLASLLFVTFSCFPLT